MAQIAKLKEADRGHVRALELFIMKEYLEAMLNRKWEELSQDFIDQLGATSNGAFELYLKSGLSFVAKEKGQIVGFVFTQMVEHMSNIPKMVWVESIGVHPSHQRKGIGYRLLKKACEEGKKAGAQAVQSAILPENAKSMLLHKKLGFFLDARKLSFLDLESLK